jgi:hypothetical protein
LLCNASSVEPTDLARKVAGVVLADRLRPAAPRLAPVLTRAEVDRALGLYRDAGTGVPLRVVREGDGLRIERGDPLTALSGTRFATPDDEVFEVVSDGEARMTDVYGSVTRYLRVEPAAPAPAELRQYEGSYASDEAEVILRIAVEGGALVIRRRPDTAIRLTPLYEDAFRGSIGTVIFRRTDGKVTALSVSQERVWDLRFALRPAASTSR